MKNGKTKKMRYKVKVIKTKAPTDLERSKKAFAIQNQYRKAKGVKELEWSDEIYEFCRYRLKTSGYDKHVNLANDMNAYFGGFAGYKNLLFSENMTTGATAKDAMESWKRVRNIIIIFFQNNMCVVRLPVTKICGLQSFMTRINLILQIGSLFR